ncbi:MAG: DUF6076 domain-containing protein [Ruminococcus flavefaciens]|nr:DUF6076 domain-containing protein [Ruminococcus flavefaciens]
MFGQLKQSSAECSVNYAYRKARGGFHLLERYTFPTLRDFLYVELGKSIIRGNAPRKCRLCGGWFLHERGGAVHLLRACRSRRDRADLPGGRGQDGL